MMSICCFLTALWLLNGILASFGFSGLTSPKDFKAILGVFRSAASSRRHFERRESPGERACYFRVASARHLKNREQDWDKRVTKQTTTNYKKEQNLFRLCTLVRAS